MGGSSGLQCVQTLSPYVQRCKGQGPYFSSAHPLQHRAALETEASPQSQRSPVPGQAVLCLCLSRRMGEGTIGTRGMPSPQLSTARTCTCSVCAVPPDRCLCICMTAAPRLGSNDTRAQEALQHATVCRCMDLLGTSACDTLEKVHHLFWCMQPGTHRQVFC